MPAGKQNRGLGHNFPAEMPLSSGGDFSQQGQLSIWHTVMLQLNPVASLHAPKITRGLIGGGLINTEQSDIKYIAFLIKYPVNFACKYTITY